MVLDASALIEWLLQTAAGAKVEARILSEPAALHAPHLLDIEVAQVLRRYAAAGIITATRGRQAISDRMLLPCARRKSWSGWLKIEQNLGRGGPRRR